MRDAFDNRFADFVEQGLDVVVARNGSRRIRQAPSHALRQLHLEVAQTIRTHSATKARHGRLGDFRALSQLGDARAHGKVDVAQHHLANLALGWAEFGQRTRMWGIRFGADTRVFLMGSRSGIRV